MIVHFIEGITVGIVITAAYIKIKKHRKKTVRRNKFEKRNNKEFAYNMFKCSILNTLSAKRSYYM